MEKIMDVKNIPIGGIVPYARNAKKHDKRQIDNVAESIRQYGFVQPVVIDRDGVIVIGHCRVLAAKKLGMESVPCVCVDDLTPEQVNALRLVDNKTNESDWDFDLLADELDGLDLSEFDFDFSFPELDESEIEEMTNEQREQEFRERMERGELSDDDEDYQAFLEKFEAKKTTDDCYTPANIYDVAKQWCLKKYKLGNPPVVRPFYPGGDYKKESYPKGCVVIDNPPFSIISEICEWYTKNGIAYFLFAPTLTLLGIMRGKTNYVACGSGVVYENGASVNTSFVTNLGRKKIIAASDLREQMDEANKENLAQHHKTLPKYEYPDEVLTATMLCYMAAHGVSLEICADDVHFIRGLDAQKESGKALFGSGYLLSKKAAAEKAAAEKAAAEKVRVCDTNVWELSDREKKIVAGLGHDD